MIDKIALTDRGSSASSHGEREPTSDLGLRGQWGHLSDTDLLARTLEARRAAHDAPLARIFEENKNGKPTGVKHISDHTRGYADRSNEWMGLAAEVSRRGLPQPIPDWDGDSRR